MSWDKFYLTTYIFKEGVDASFSSDTIIKNDE